nr:hypothetical protein BgiMline_014476 [Biomphalaria glabrata]
MKQTFFLANCLTWLTVCIFTAQSETPCYPCDPSWPRPIYYPDFKDCAYIWECSNGALTRTSCDAGLVFDFLMQACVPDAPEMLFTCAKLMGQTSCVNATAAAAASGL